MIIMQWDEIRSLAISLMFFNIIIVCLEINVGILDSLSWEIVLLDILYCV